MSTSSAAAVKFRQALPTASLSHLERLATKLTDIRNPDSARRTSLALAAEFGRLDVVEWLIIDEGHDQEEISRDNLGDTVLHVAARKDHAEILELYLSQYDFVLDWANSKGATALHAACEAGSLETAQLLIEYGTDINAPDLQGNSPLHYAASWGKLPLVELLMGLGCLHLVKNNEGFSAQEYAFSFAIANAIKELSRVQADAAKKQRRKGASDSSPITVRTSAPDNKRDLFSTAPLLYDDPPTPTGSPDRVFTPFRSANLSEYTQGEDSPLSVATLSPIVSFQSPLRHATSHNRIRGDSTTTTTTTTTSSSLNTEELSPLAQRIRPPRSPSLLSGDSTNNSTSSIDHQQEALRDSQAVAQLRIEQGISSVNTNTVVKPSSSSRAGSFSSLRPPSMLTTGTGNNGALFQLTARLPPAVSRSDSISNKRPSMQPLPAPPEDLHAVRSRSGSNLSSSSSTPSSELPLLPVSSLTMGSLRLGSLVRRPSTASGPLGGGAGMERTESSTSIVEEHEDVLANAGAGSDYSPDMNGSSGRGHGPGRLKSMLGFGKKKVVADAH